MKTVARVQRVDSTRWQGELPLRAPPQSRYDWDQKIAALLFHSDHFTHEVLLLKVDLIDFWKFTLLTLSSYDVS